MTVIKPLQVICSSVTCRRRQIVPGDRIWYVDVRSGPGSHREAGWACRFCRTENCTPPLHLPRNTIPILPSREEVLHRIKASAPERTEASMNHNEAAVLNGMAQPARAPEGSSRQGPPIRVGGASGIAKVVDVPTRVPEDGLISADPAVRGGDDRDGAEAGGQPGGPAPTWVVGDSAKATLIQALSRIARHGGNGMAVCRGLDGFRAVDVNLSDDADLNDSEIAASAGVLLEQLDQMHADVLVLGGDVSGSRWEAILHFRAGAASFV